MPEHLIDYIDYEAYGRDIRINDGGHFAPGGYVADTDSTYNFIVALAFSQMFNLLCERADNKYGGRLPHHVRVMTSAGRQQEL